MTKMRRTEGNKEEYSKKTTRKEGKKKMSMEGELMGPNE